MADRLVDRCRAALALGHYEGALQDRLGIETEGQAGDAFRTSIFGYDLIEILGEARAVSGNALSVRPKTKLSGISGLA